jgi:hypothetical protein
MGPFPAAGFFLFTREDHRIEVTRRSLTAGKPKAEPRCAPSLAVRATLVVRSESWTALSPGEGELVDYVVPRQLG